MQSQYMTSNKIVIEDKLIQQQTPNKRSLIQALSVTASEKPQAEKAILLFSAR